MEWNLKNDNFTYILRYCLPCLPQYDADVTKARCDELIEYCKKYSVDAVMLYVDLNPYWYYMPDTKEHNAYVVEVIKPLAERLRKENISYQINYQDLFGSWAGNSDHRSMYGWECYVDEFGRNSLGTGCMIGKKFREIAGEKLKAWAETKPDAIWIDDDMRYHNHGTDHQDFWEGKGPAEWRDFGCYCDNHISLFNERYNLSVTREEIVQSMIKADSDKTLAIKYKEFLNDTLCDTAKWIENTVHSVSPDTKVAIMTSNPDVHSLEGRNWNDFLSSLSGDKTPLIRPTFGPYRESCPLDFAECYKVIRHLEENIEFYYDGKYDMCPEIENTRFTVYSKSLAATSYQIMLSAFFGYGGVTLSIYDLDGVRLEEESEFGVLLNDRKSFCDKLTALNTRECENAGIAFMTVPDRHPKRDAGRISGLLNPRTIDSVLAKLGVPYTYVTPKNFEKADVLVLNRDTASVLTDSELKRALSKSLILDSGAAQEIESRGFGEYLGLCVGNKIKTITASEELLTLKRTDGSKVIVPSRICGNSWKELELNDAKALTHLFVPSGKTFPGLTRYKNTLGGTVCVFAAEEDFGDGFYTNYRVKLLRELFSELSPSLCITKFKSYGSVVQLTKENEDYLFATNLCADPEKDLKIVLPYTPSNVTIIDENGKETKIIPTDNVITVNTELNIYGSVALRIIK